MASNHRPPRVSCHTWTNAGSPAVARSRTMSYKRQLAGPDQVDEPGRRIVRPTGVTRPILTARLLVVHLVHPLPSASPDHGPATPATEGAPRQSKDDEWDGEPGRREPPARRRAVDRQQQAEHAEHHGVTQWAAGCQPRREIAADDSERRAVDEHDGEDPPGEGFLLRLGKGLDASGGSQDQVGSVDHDFHATIDDRIAPVLFNFRDEYGPEDVA
jgi:hypothetical protein